MHPPTPAQTTTTTTTTVRQHNETALSISVPTPHADVLARALRQAGHDAEDTGRRITTEEGVDAEAVLAVRLTETL